MKFSNQYLLTHHPLAWNTRIVWVLIAQVIVHLLFFLSGLASISVTSFKEHYSITSVGESSVITFSILCTLLTYVVWLIFFLRNNALKSNYLLGPRYLAKEFLIIFLISYLAITYFESFYTGVRMRVRSITPAEIFQKESDIIHKAKAFVPTSNGDYFVLGPGRTLDTTVLVGNSVTKEILEVREALKRPDAFSYIHYKGSTLDSYYEVIYADKEDSIQRHRWLTSGSKDSIRGVLVDFIQVLKKYNIEYSFPLDSLVNLPFQNSTFTPTFYLRTDEYDYVDNRRDYNPHFLQVSDLRRVYSFIEDSHHTAKNWDDKFQLLMIMGYVALSLSIFILCYRRFTRKVFLITIIGGILWIILVSLMVAGSGSIVSFPSITLILGILFYMAGVLFLRSEENKSMTGALLSWHAWLLPFLMICLYFILEYNYDNIFVPEHISRAGLAYEFKKEQSPFLTWVHDNDTLIIWMNLFLSIVYITGPFNKLAKRWRLMPEQ